MEQYAGIDVSLEASHVCIVDSQGKILKEAKVASEQRALIAWFAARGAPLTRIGLEAGPLSQWLYAGMKAADLPVELLETRHVRDAFKSMPVKTDRKDARGIAQLMRLGWFRPVHCKSVPAQEVRALLAARKLLQTKRLDVEMSVRGLLRGFGLKIGPTTPKTFEVRAKALVLHHGTLGLIADALLRARDPARFRSSRLVGAHFGLTQKRYQSGETDITGRISKIGDRGVRTALYEAAHVILTRPVKGSELKVWAMGVAKRTGMKKAKVALARKLAVVMHRMLADGTTFVSAKAARPAVVRHNRREKRIRAGGDRHVSIARSRRRDARIWSGR